MTNLETSDVLVRRLRKEDLEPVIALDAHVTGRRRDKFFELKLAQALAHSGIEVSLAAEVDDVFVGFLLVRVFYGEFGATEKSAVLDTIDVHPDFRGRGVANAMLEQLCTNLLGLGIKALQTEVSWDDQALLGFFHREGFVPAHRICLDLPLEKARSRFEAAASLT